MKLFLTQCFPGEQIKDGMITCMEVMNVEVSEGQHLSHIFPAVLHYSVFCFVFLSYCQCQYQYGIDSVRNWEFSQMKYTHKTHTHTHIQ